MLASACPSGKLWKWFSLHPATYWITPCLLSGEEKQAELSLWVVTLNTFVAELTWCYGWSKWKAKSNTINFCDMLGWISVHHIWFKTKWQPLKYNDNVFSKVLSPRKQLEDRNHGLKHLHLVWKVHHCPFKWSFLTSSPNNKQKQCTYKTSNKHSLQSFSYIIPSNSSAFFEWTRVCHMTCVKNH